ncbi:NAD(P)-dependent oxidoreductase [Lacisediminihabitans sp.]|jgi:nucleoside-diphosphate-sugar epimerase|uniref:NAD-dependent epimerase/dehydratase family protein n=1 Tax=Lacisediminihabitans sp. TaxID=2787631 RepID=UPI002F944EC9
MRVGVLGAAGFLGSWTVRALLGAGHEAVAIVRPTTDVWRIGGLPGLDVVARPSADWPLVIREKSFDSLVFLDWEGVAAGTRDDDVQWSNLDRHRAMIAAAAEAGVRRIVGLGSQAEYGPRSDRAEEESTTNPATTYGQAKVAAMEQLRDLCESRGIDWVWARVFSVYGPMDNAGMLLSSVAGRLAADEDIDLSSGEQRWSYLYAFDAGAALATLTTHREARGIVNVGNPLAPRLREIVEEFASNFDTTGRLNFAPKLADPGGIAHLDPVTERLVALGWSPEVSTPEGLALTARWLKGEPVADPYFAGRRIPEPPRD